MFFLPEVKLFEKSTFLWCEFAELNQIQVIS